MICCAVNMYKIRFPLLHHYSKGFTVSHQSSGSASLVGFTVLYAALVLVGYSSDNILLNRAIARFKTPGLRDLGHSAPYMHNGQFDRLNDIVQFYRDVSQQARAGSLRNGASQLQGIALIGNDMSPLVAFLESLNEDYE